MCCLLYRCKISEMGDEPREDYFAGPISMNAVHDVVVDNRFWEDLIVFRLSR